MSRTRYRRVRGIRAFADKNGGWTLVTHGGEFVRLRNAASLCLWEALTVATDLDALTDRLRASFPLAPPERLRRDVRRFLRDLAAHGFVETRMPEVSTRPAPAEAD